MEEMKGIGDYIEEELDCIEGELDYIEGELDYIEALDCIEEGEENTEVEEEVVDPLFKINEN